MAGATRPVQGGAYSSPRSEPGGQNTPRAGRVVASYGAYTTALGLFAQQVDQGDIFDDAADASAIVTASGSGAENYQFDDNSSGTATASGSGTESWSGPVFYTDATSGTATASGTRLEQRVYADNATYYDNALDLDNPTSHWKLGDPSTAVDRKGQRNLPAVSGPIATASGIVTNNAEGTANEFTGTANAWFTQSDTTGIGLPYQGPYTMEVWLKPTADANGGVMSRTPVTNFNLQPGTGTQTQIRHNYEDSLGNDNPLGAGTFLTVGATSHLVATHDGSTVILYVNGVERARVTGVNGTRSAPNTTPNIGGARGGTWLRGVADEVAWYPTALTAARVLAHYQAGTVPAGVTAPGAGTVTASGTSTELYVPPPTVYTDTGAGTVTATGTGTDSYETGTVYTDTGTATVTASGTGTETAAANDTSTGTATSSGASTESQARSSTATAAITASGTGTDAAAYTDTQPGSLTTAGTGSDTWIRGYLDAGTATTTTSGTSTESYATDDTATGTVTVTGSGLDSHADTGTGTATLTATGTSLEAHTHTDSATGTLALTGTGTGDYQLGATTYTDTAAGTTTTTGSSLEAHTSSDSASGQVTAAGTGLESYLPGPTVHTDTGTGSVTSTGTGAEAYSCTDTAAGLLTLTGAGTESYAYGYVDSSTGETTLSGSGLEDRTYTDSTLGLALITGTGTESTLPRQLAISTITLNQPTYTIAIQNGNMATTLTAAAAPTIRIIATPSITTSIKPPAPIAVELERIT